MRDTVGRKGVQAKDLNDGLIRAPITQKEVNASYDRREQRLNRVEKERRSKVFRLWIGMQQTRWCRVGCLCHCEASESLDCEIVSINAKPRCWQEVKGWITHIVPAEDPILRT